MKLKSSARVTIVQYAGDFREAATRLSNGGDETYRGQRYTVGAVERMADDYESVSTITGFTAEPYDETLPSGVRAIGLGFRSRWQPNAVYRALDSTRPTRVVLRTVDPILLTRLSMRGTPTLAMLADSFQGRSLRSRLSRALIVRLLNRSNVEMVANHGRNATEHLADLGVLQKKLVAWDYPTFDSPASRAEKSSPAAASIIYVGMLAVEKGIGDLVQAMKGVLRQLPNAHLTIVGTGKDEGLLKAVADQAGLGPALSFAGMLPNAEVVRRMRDADIVVVPSRHEYSEGLPLTIYEALCARTPLVVSDHPMFLQNVEHEYSGLVFRAGDVHQLSEAIVRLLTDTRLYQAMSRNAEAAWQRLQIPNKWHSVIYDWLSEVDRSHGS